MQMKFKMFQRSQLYDLRLHSIVFPDNIDLKAKIKWLRKNEYKKWYWWQWSEISDRFRMMLKNSDPNMDDIANWMIRERTIGVDENRLCFNPWAFCWSSGKRLFLKRATVVHTEITGPGDPLKESFYFDPKRYTIWLLKQ